MFQLGTIYATPGILAGIPEDEIIDALQRHSSGDWGILSDDDRQANEDALTSGARLLSSYRASDGSKFWIITDGDDDAGVRHTTTILLPEEY